MQLLIDPEFKALLPPLTPEELAKLENNLVADGCREPLMVWNGYLVDGHNRYEICTRRKLPYETRELQQPDRDGAMLWMLANQGGRRNLADIDRIAIAAKREVIIARQAKENQRLSAKSEGLATSPNPPHPINTRAESAKAAGVGEKKYDEGKVILQAVESGEVEPEVIHKIRTGETTVHAEAKKIKAVREEKEAKVSDGSMNQELPHEEPEFYSREQLAARVGLSVRSFTRHEERDVAGLRTKGRERVPGLGIVYPAGRAAVKRYIALCAAARPKVVSGQ